METIISMMIFAVIFTSFFLYCKKRAFPLMLPASMTYFWDAIFFLRDSDICVLSARLALLAGLPILYCFIFLEHGVGREYFLFVVSAWMLCLIFKYLYQPDNSRELKGSRFFGAVILSNPPGFCGIALWFVRVLYIISFFIYFYAQWHVRI
jgi:hypothetical protein